MHAHMHTHAHTRACTHARARAHTHTHTHTHTAYRVAGPGTFHLAETGDVRLEDVHLLHQGGESRLCGFSHLLINTFGL